MPKNLRGLEECKRLAWLATSLTRGSSDVQGEGMSVVVDSDLHTQDHG